MITKKKVITVVAVISAIWTSYIVFHHNPLADPHQELIKKIVSVAVLWGAFSVFAKLYDRIIILPQELWANRKLIWKLSKNDFRSKYAGSYMGIVWIFLQPAVTVLVYWFVFTMGGRAPVSETGQYPFVLWLIVGIVPWFFFSDAWGQGTGALLSYQFLVKKVVFKISILPIIKIMSTLFIHVFLVVVTLVILILNGIYPDIYWIQIFYFSGCTFLLVLGISYITCSVVVFFRDLGQIIGILLQVGVWITPIMWDINNLSRPLQMIFKLNPVFYVVDGYRMALLDHMWFFEHFYSTVYFWIFTVASFLFGALVFKRLKVHFADIL